MSKRKTIAVAISAVIMSVGISQGGTLGQTYVEGLYRHSSLKDVQPEMQDHIDLYGLGIRLGGEEHMDFTADVDAGTWEDIDLIVASAGFQPYLWPEEGFYKVFGDIRALYTKAERDGYSSDELGYSMGLGSELDLASIVTFVAQVAYEDIDSEDDIIVSGSLHRWVTDWLMLDIGMEYGMQSEETTARIGIAVGFSPNKY